MSPDPFPPVPLEPAPPKVDGFWTRSATKAAIVSTAMGAFGVARAIRAAAPGTDPWLLVIDFGESTVGTWLSAWLGISAAGRVGR